MTHDERRKYSEVHVQKVLQLERKHRKGLFKAMLLQMEGFISNMRSHGIQFASQQNELTLMNTHVGEAVRTLYVDAGTLFAARTEREIKRASNRKADGILGNNPQWVQQILQYFQTRLLNDAVIPITQTTRAQIKRVLTQAIDEGWSIDEIAARLESRDMTFWRAQMIARTEIGKAANVGRDIAATESEFETEKEWITAGDHRVRDWHAEVDGVVVGMDETFSVYGESMNGPGDPDASAANVINCRCTLAIVPKRNRRGNLIMK